MPNGHTSTTPDVSTAHVPTAGPANGTAVGLANGTTSQNIGVPPAPAPHNPDRIGRYYQPDEMAGADRSFTFHVNFTAHDEQHAKLLAERYARGINHMRLEVDPYSAQVSTGDDWTAAHPVCCLAHGPHPADLCTELAGHHCDHNGPGVTGRCTDA